MKSNNRIGVLILNNFFDCVINKLPNDFKIFSIKDLDENKKSIKAIITSPWTKVNKQLIDSLPNLKIISSFGVGLDAIDLIAAAKKQVIVTNTPDLVTDDTADLAITLLLTLARNIVSSDSFVRKQKWCIENPPLGTSVKGKTLGIVGLGKIGKGIADRAKAFGLKIIYYGRENQNNFYTYFDNLSEMAKQSDFLVVSCTGDESTKNLINLDVLNSLGEKGFLINVSRGSTVNEEDLLRALENKTIKGAGLDVYKNEPHISEKFLQLDNIILLPHIGTATLETRQAMLDLVIDNITAFFKKGAALTPINSHTPAWLRSKL